MNSDIEKLLKKYFTARIDIKSIRINENNIVILNNSDSNSKVTQPNWFSDDDGVGTIIESCEGTLDLKIRCVNDGELKICLRGPDIKDINNQRFPIYIDYIKFSVNDNEIINNHILISHDNKYIFTKYVLDSEIVDIHIEWLPFNESSEFNDNSQETIQSLKNKLSIKEKQINSIPQLSNTTLGTSALNGKVTYRNWRSQHQGRSIQEDFNGFCENIWFTRYLKHKFPNDDFDINIFGVCQAHDNLTYPMYGKKVLYSIEDLNYRYLEMKYRFDRYALDYVDFAMGFDVIDNPKYLRFPYWMIKHFNPEVTDEEIENKVNLWNSTTYDKSKNVASISGLDKWGTRSLIADSISPIVDITYAGKWRNNTSELWEDYNNSKDNFLKEFKFNLCSENVISNGYVSEKIFDAINCDCIPLYAGGGNYLEPEVINPKAIIRWVGDERPGFDPDLKEHAYMGNHAVHYPLRWVDEDGKNSDSIELFKNLLTDKKTYDEFKDQNKILDSSAKFIIKTFSELEKHFERLIYS